MQGLIYSFARRSYLYDSDPLWSWTFPRLDAQSLSEFGAWCVAGSPVTVAGQVHRTGSLNLPGSSSDRIWRIDSL